MPESIKIRANLFPKTMKQNKDKTIAALRSALASLAIASGDAHDLLLTFRDAHHDARTAAHGEALVAAWDAHAAAAPDAKAKVLPRNDSPDLALILADCEANVIDAEDLASEHPIYPQDHQAMAEAIIDRSKAIAKAAKRLAK